MLIIGAALSLLYLLLLLGGLGRGLVVVVWSAAGIARAIWGLVVGIRGIRGVIVPIATIPFLIRLVLVNLLSLSLINRLTSCSCSQI